MQNIRNTQTDLDRSSQLKPQLQYLRSHSEEVCFEIKKFLIEGDNAQDFTFAMRSVTQGKYNIIGRCIGVQGLNQAINLAQNNIISRGYVTTRILLPPQNIAAGKEQL